MAINFEAANMAGYNNPKIEVFKAALAADGATLAQYPDKAAIIAAINRGSLPFIRLKMATGAGFVLPLHSWTPTPVGDHIIFCLASSTVGEYVIQYGPDSEPPVFQTGS